MLYYNTIWIYVYENQTFHNNPNCFVEPFFYIEDDLYILSTIWDVILIKTPFLYKKNNKKIGIIFLVTKID